MGRHQPGHYPPSHQLVISMDLLKEFKELAELLWQAEPQTTSKEDINNSSFEVKPMSALAKDEKVGQVLPMCVDRLCASILLVGYRDGTLMMVGRSASSVCRTGRRSESSR
jgi:hypothetical protein